ncbi:RagB/SusD family nutrient uptake outer membrane protein [Spirosoma sp. HMF4905]|uniref:RagB/SusD family nutrient uptake outer membrane protein n=1 Tax=Spirosoma arboris TaxID=2682092 RepID=A0A7K1SJL6_9BACT|nr:RagB/SusD family nutrient uptake outer membrane protein [Spirosoma arboris]MVM33975.1 RagB/SusD family nutrient uptake outer membrane protein [Spirosoma arboris]
MKTYKLTIAFVGCLVASSGLFSCQDQLREVIPQTSLNQSLVLSDANAALTLYTGVYSSFRTYHSTLFTLGEMRSDIWADGLFTESEDTGLKQYWSHNISATNVPIDNWGGLYNLIDRINTVIKLFPAAPLDEAKRKTCLAEMYGMRAYVYYTLLQTWGGVPISTDPVTSVDNLTDLYKARSTPDEVMKLIKSDLEQSLTLFAGNNAFATKRVNWSRAATLTLKGDVFIWSGTHMGGGNADFTTAKSALDEVKALPTLGLQGTFADIFDPTKKSNNKEIIFAINYEKNEATQGVYGNFLVNTTQAGTLFFDPVPGPAVAVNATYPLVSGASRVGMSSATLTKLSNAKDQRIRPSFRVMYRNTAGFPIAGVMLTKFIGRVDSGIQLYDNDFPIYRYADVLLLLSEANTKLGNDPSADINAIRARAYGTGFTVYTNGSQEANMNAILDEYLREFIGEGKRWWALRRAGNAYVFAAVNPVYLPATQVYKLLLPISISMLNTDPKLVQTPGY